MPKDVQSYIRKLEAVERVNRLYPRRAGMIALEFVKDRFRQQNWIGDRTETWPRRSYTIGGQGRNTLTGKGAGSLRRSYRITRSNPQIVAIGSDKPYAVTHNEGMRIPITENMRGLFMAKHIDAKERGKVKDAQFWLNMATTKKKFIEIPRRQHIGESQYMIRKIERQFVADHTKALKS